EQRDEFRDQHEAAAIVEAAQHRDVPCGRQCCDRKCQQRKSDDEHEAGAPDGEIAAATIAPPARPGGKDDLQRGRGKREGGGRPPGGPPKPATCWRCRSTSAPGGRIARYTR